MTPRAAIPAAIALAAIVALAGCQTPEPDPVPASAAAVNTFGSFTSANPRTVHGRTTANADVGVLTGAGFGWLDPTGAFVEDRSFGTAEVVDDEPFTVRYTLADAAVWSDGVAIDASDLLLSWAALRLDVDAGEGGFEHVPGGALAGTPSTIEADEGDRSVEVRFDRPVAGWRTALMATIPAHVAAARALGAPDDDPDAGKLAVRAAVEDEDPDALAALAAVWNTGYDFVGTPDDPSLLVAAGPYVVRAVSAEAVELTANPEYRGDRAPGIASITVRTLPDSATAVAELAAGRLDVARIGVLGAVQDAAAIAGVTTSLAASSRTEYLALEATAPLHPALLDDGFRRALLAVVPRQQIVETVLASFETDPVPTDSWVSGRFDPGYAELVEGNGSEDVLDLTPDEAASLVAAAPAPAEVCVLYDPSSARRAVAFGMLRDAAAAVGIAVTDCSRPDWRAVIGTPGAYDAVLDSFDALALVSPVAVDTLAVDEPRPAPLQPLPADVAAAVDELAEADPDGPGDPDAGTRAAALLDLDSLLWASHLGTPLYSLPSGVASRAGLTGVTPHPGIRSALWDAWGWRTAPAP